MPHRKPARYAFAAIALLLAACGSPEISSAISEQLARTGGRSVDLATVVKHSWDRVCILGPYSNNKIAQSTLGFEWDAELRTSIQFNEGISLLVFVSGQDVVAYVEHPRNMGDFSNLTARCFPRSNAQFNYDPHPKNGWPGLFPAHVA
jgi:hypothetical protein